MNKHVILNISRDLDFMFYFKKKSILPTFRIMPRPLRISGHFVLLAMMSKNQTAMLGTRMTGLLDTRPYLILNGRIDLSDLSFAY